ncbi:hypothetical protein Dsin_007377 [Dipteronia sinensis]|uniref:DYW domain-containing protein n=1 Tax=Dipteronia sinensis TaxID=43782 RepID=A0AAE0EIC9_9ROSI|nr:hypothetical protein Dsin_007377 [Dipteronia sinensis]
MATTTLHHFPVKTITSPTTITQFPENPKTLILQQCKTTKDLNQVHAHLIKTRLHLNPSFTENLLESAAILIPNTTMDYALSIFSHINEPDSSAYNVMIRAFTLKKSPQEALILYQKMHENSVQPDHFTFPSTLKACSRLRVLREGEQIHAQIVKSGYGSNDLVDNTLIHMYANCGKIEFARKVFDGTSKSDVFAWNSMLSGYVRSECWGEVLKLFDEMRDTGVGFDEEVYIAAEKMIKKIKSAGYMPNAADARLDAEEDDKEASVAHHSEKLAIAFGLIKTRPGTTIRISKNLRVCSDCHNATKIISKVFSREIVVRDRNRFHHFKEGSCSCNDYW